MFNAPQIGWQSNRIGLPANNANQVALENAQQGAFSISKRILVLYSLDSRACGKKRSPTLGGASGSNEPAPIMSLWFADRELVESARRPHHPPIADTLGSRSVPVTANLCMAARTQFERPNPRAGVNLAESVRTCRFDMIRLESKVSLERKD